MLAPAEDFLFWPQEGTVVKQKMTTFGNLIMVQVKLLRSIYPTNGLKWPVFPAMGIVLLCNPVAVEFTVYICPRAVNYQQLHLTVFFLKCSVRLVTAGRHFGDHVVELYQFTGEELGKHRSEMTIHLGVKLETQIYSFIQQNVFNTHDVQGIMLGIGQKRNKT